MSDSERAEILKNSIIDICNVSNTSVVGIDYDNLENNIKSAVENINGLKYTDYEGSTNHAPYSLYCL